MSHPLRPASLTNRFAPLLLCAMLASCASPKPDATEVVEADESEEDGGRAKSRPVVLDGTAWQNGNHIEGVAPTARWEHQV